jgi:hypothetical protein
MKKLLFLALLVLCSISNINAQEASAVKVRKTGTEMIALLKKGANQPMKIIANELENSEGLGYWLATFDSARNSLSFSNGKSTVSATLEVGADFLLLQQFEEQVDMVLQKTSDTQLGALRLNFHALKFFTDVQLQENTLRFYNGDELLLVTRFVMK